MERLAPTARSSKRRRLDSGEQNEDAIDLLSDKSNQGWSLPGFGFVERMLRRRSTKDASDPHAHRNDLTDSRPANDADSFIDSAYQSTDTTMTLENGHDDEMVMLGDQENAEQVTGKENDDTIIPARRTSGRVGRRSQHGSLRSEGVDQHVSATTDGDDRTSLGRRRRSGRQGIAADTAGAASLTAGSGKRRVKKDKAEGVWQDEGRTTHDSKLRRRIDGESPDPISDGVEASARSPASTPKTRTGTKASHGKVTDETTVRDEEEDLWEVGSSPPAVSTTTRAGVRQTKNSVEVRKAVRADTAKTASVPLAGILSPSKHDKAGLRGKRKSVAFQSSKGTAREVEFGFKDVVSSRTRRPTSSTDVPPHDTDEQHREDEVDDTLIATDDQLRNHIEDFTPNVQTEDTLMSGYLEMTDISEQAKEPPEFAKRFSRLLREHSLDQKLELLAELVMGQLTSKRRIPLVGLDDEYSKIHQTVKQTVVAGEGNSILILGARGTGKTSLVETVVTELDKDYHDDFYVVRLNGFIHTDDRLALREIWRQLGREMETESESDGQPTSYADTLSALLALLSHPEEITGETDTTAKAVIFILDEFDLFASHPRQTLLYNLFDIAQARKAPIAVLGLSTKVDVVESLEKRVKSRFSHRYVHLPLPKSFTTFETICRAGLEVHPDEEYVFGGGKGLLFLEGWREYLKELFSKDTLFTTCVQQIYYRTKSVQEVFTAFSIPIMAMSRDNLLDGQALSQHALLAPDSKLHLLDGLSTLELSLLIAAARLNVILDQEQCSFTMAFGEYQNMVSRAKLQSSASGATAAGAGVKVWTRQLSLGAWERLADYELLVPSLMGGGGGTSKDASRDGRMFKVDVALEEIVPSVSETSGVTLKWCKEI